LLKNLWRKIGSWVKLNAKKILTIRASAHQVALGVALGVFIGIFPTFGLGGLLVLGLAPLIKFNVPAAFIGGSLLSNPILAPLWVFLSCWIAGIDISMIDSPEQTIGNLMSHYSKVIGMYVTGNTVVSTIVALISYGVTFIVMKKYQRRQKKLAIKSETSIQKPL
jgi:uncharacterized protein (DUF2062 family)